MVESMLSGTCRGSSQSVDRPPRPLIEAEDLLSKQELSAAAHLSQPCPPTPPPRPS